MHLNVLSSSVEHWVVGQVDVAHVVAIQKNQILYGNTQILQYSLEPNGFTCSNDRTLVFNLCAR